MPDINRRSKPDPILAAIETLNQLTVAEIRDADDVLLGKLYHATDNWHQIAYGERRRRSAAAIFPRSAPPTRSQERP